MVSRTQHSQTQPTQQNKQQMSNINLSNNERVIALVTGLGFFAVSRRMKGIQRFALSALSGELIRQGITGHSFLFSLLGMNPAVETNKYAVSVPHEQGLRVEHSLTINRPVEDVYNFWRNFENLPQFMRHLKSVEILENGHSRWTARGPLNAPVSWEAEIINEVPNEVIGWRSLANSQIANAGSVRFSRVPGNRGTQVKVELEYIPPAGQVGAVIAGIFGERPEQQIQEDLNRFKQLMETGEINSTNGQPRGRHQQ